jgi:GNAT superfamily N-acetyltransferase
MILRHDDYEIDDSITRQDFDLVFGWLRTTYWWQYGLTREKVERGARHCALVVGAYLDGDGQVAYARVVSDTIRFAWIADVYVAPAHRDKGLARAIVRFALDHPALSDVHVWLLGTRDAHGVYAPLGFARVPDQNNFMILRREAGSS